MSIIGYFTTIIDLLASGAQSLVDFIISLPTFLYSLLEVVPLPLKSVFLSFMGLIIVIIILKVVSHFA